MKADKPTLIAYTVKEGRGAQAQGHLDADRGGMAAWQWPRAIPFVWKHCRWMAGSSWSCL